MKHDDGDLLLRLTAVPEKTSGFYAIRFPDGVPKYQFSEAGHYLLELHVSPLKGEPFDVSVPFELPKTAAPIAPLWRRALPLILGVLMLATLTFLLLRSGEKLLEVPLTRLHFSSISSQNLL